jgi:hypothetical protein
MAAKPLDTDASVRACPLAFATPKSITFVTGRSV